MSKNAIFNCNRQESKKDSTLIAGIPIIAHIPWNKNLLRPRVLDVVSHLDAQILSKSNIDTSRYSTITMCARSIDNIIESLVPDNLVITAGDRSEILIAAAMATMNGCKIPGIILTGGYKPSSNVIEFCKLAFDNLIVLLTNNDSFTTALLLDNMPKHIRSDDIEQQEYVGSYIADLIDDNWSNSVLSSKVDYNLTPASFCYQLMQKSQQNPRRILLPESKEPRIIEAAIICASKNLATPVFLANKDDVAEIALKLGLSLPNNIDFVNPEEHRKKLIKKLVDLRKHKGMTKDIAEAQLNDDMVLATLMLHQGLVDGIVAGAITTTANTIRPALQLIKTCKDANIVSSIFFMCLPEQVMIYADCAINPDPTAEELAEIAIQSALSAKKFGIDPKIAMLSYSTGSSGKGADIDKINSAIDIVNKSSYNFDIDGPLQYDAAINEDVAALKSPNSKVAGKASICIFPNLSTANTTYKAVQRSAGVLSIGPILQGLNKPVNDLSRGATIKDIVYTIVITSIQAENL